MRPFSLAVLLIAALACPAPGQDSSLFGGGFEPPHPLDLSVLEKVRPSAGEGQDVNIAADSTVQVTNDQVEFTGHVRAKRRGQSLDTDRVRWDRTGMVLNALGNVKVGGPRFELSCGRLRLHTRHEIGVAWESPRIMQVRKDGAGDALERTEIHAIQIAFFTNEDRVEGLERVRIFRWMRRNGEMVLDFKISADSLDANLLTQRSVLKGHVLVESPTHKITANRLIFDQQKGRFTAVGEAKVEGINAQGQITNLIEGNKLVYFIDQRRTIVSGGVAGVIDAEKQGGVRTLDISDEVLRDKEIPIIPLSGLEAER